MISPSHIYIVKDVADTIYIKPLEEIKKIPSTYNEDRAAAHQIMEEIFSEYQRNHSFPLCGKLELRVLLSIHIENRDFLGDKICSLAKKILSWDWSKIEKLRKKLPKAERHNLKEMRYIVYSYLAVNRDPLLLCHLIEKAASTKIMIKR